MEQRPIRAVSLRRPGALIAALAAALALALPIAATPASANLNDGNVTLTVLTPQPGTVVTSPTLPVHVLASGYRLDARYAGTPVLADVGHFHTIIDGHLIDMSPYQDGNRDEISMVGISPGPHTLTIAPARNDHSEIKTAAVNIPFTYAGPALAEPPGYTGAGAPTIALTAPANSATVQGSSFVLTADVQNFVLCGDCFGKADVAGEGHWHIFLDLPPTAMDPMAMMPHMVTMAGDATQTVSLKGIPKGSHTFTGILVGNDHMPVMPMAMSTVTLTVR